MDDFLLLTLEQAIAKVRLPRCNCLGCTYQQPYCKYQGFWIEIFTKEDGSHESVIELPNQEGCICFEQRTQSEARLAAWLWIDKTCDRGEQRRMANKPVTEDS